MKEEGRKNIDVAFSKVVDIRAELSVLALAIGAALHVAKALANPKERSRMMAEGKAELAKLAIEDSDRPMGTELPVDVSPEAGSVIKVDPVHAELSQNETMTAHVEYRQVADAGMAGTLADPSGEHVIKQYPEAGLWISTKAEPDAETNRARKTQETAFAMAEEDEARAPAAQCNLTASSASKALPQAGLGRAIHLPDQSRKHSTPDCRHDDAEAGPSKRAELDVDSEMGSTAGQEERKAAALPHSSSSPVRAQQNLPPPRSPNPLRGSAPNRGPFGVPNGNTNWSATNLNSDQPGEGS
jgi:hypothetical protein